MFDDFYGLTGRPFQLTPDPNFYFESITHRKALSYLGYGMAQAEGFIVITGEVGAGKSTFVAHLMQKIDQDQMTVGHVVTSALDAGEVIHVIAQSFGLEIEGHDKATALGAIESFLHEEAREGRRTLLVIDESQNLSVGALEELRMLSNFQLGSHPLLQTLLLGQPEFRETLAHPELEQLRQRVIATQHLGPMEPGEIEHYIKHRLECVGWNGNPAFDQRVFAELHEATGGIPRRINQVVTRLLLLGAVEQRTRIDNSMLTAVLKEMKDDNTFPDTAPQPRPKLDRGPAPTPLKRDSMKAQPIHRPEIDPAQVDALLAQRDEQIAELQQAVIEVADGEAGGDRLHAIEQRLDEQEKAIRQTLTMLIEWVENGTRPRIAA